MEERRQNLICIAAWWPRADEPGAGMFIREHALSLSTSYDVHVVHLRVHKDPLAIIPRTLFSKSKDEGLHVYFIDIHTALRRFGLHDKLVKRAYQKKLAELIGFLKPTGYLMNVRTHLTKFVPSLPCMRTLPFVHIEHFSYYHRVFPKLETEEKSQERDEIKAWFSQPNLKQILVVSDDLKQTLMEEFTVKASRLSLIANVASDLFFPTNRSSSTQVIEAIAVARWEEPKRPDLMFDALRRLTAQGVEINLEVYGDGSLLDACKDLDSNFGVTFHGFRSKQMIAEAMQRADLMIHPTDAENAPAAIAEAHCSGLPVVSMAVNGIPEMVDASNGILVKKGDPLALADGIMHMIEHLPSVDRQAIAKEARSKYGRTAVGSLLDETLQSAFA